MVSALETFWPAARIEEELVVTKEGCEVITHFPAEELMVAGVKYYTANGPLTSIRETQSHKNLDYTGVNYGGAGLPEKAVPAAPPTNGNSADSKASSEKMTA